MCPLFLLAIVGQAAACPQGIQQTVVLFDIDFARVHTTTCAHFDITKHSEIATGGEEKACPVSGNVQQRASIVSATLQIGTCNAHCL